MIGVANLFFFGKIFPVKMIESTRSFFRAHRSPNWALVVISFSGSLVFCLLATQFYHAATKQERVYEGSASKKHPQLGMVAVPNATDLVSLTVGNQVIYQTLYHYDEYGKRRTPIRYPNRTKFHALFFGDSFTFGDGVTDRETLPAQFSTFSPHYRSYNFGMSGYGPANMLAQWEFTDLRPQIREEEGMAIFTMIEDHGHRVIGSLATVTDGWRSELPHYELDGLGVPQYRGSFSSARPVRHAIYDFLAKIRLFWMFFEDYPLVLDDADIELTAAIIDKSREKYLQMFPKGKFFVLFHPSQRIDKRMERVFASRGVEVLKFEPLWNKNDPEMILHPLDSHPSPKAHEKLAELLSRELAVGSYRPSG